jgi:hypothetical protein
VTQYGVELRLPAGFLALEEHFSCAYLRCSKDEISDPTRKSSAFGHDTCLENLPVYRLSGSSFHVLKIFFKNIIFIFKLIFF